MLFKKRKRKVDLNKLHRTVCAAVEQALSATAVLEEANSKQAHERRLFMNAYAAFIFWVTGTALAIVVDINTYGSTLTALESFLRSFEWWDEESFFRIWEMMKTVMPTALESSETAYPVVEFTQAINQAGYQLPITTNLEFGLHLSYAWFGHFKDIKLLAYESMDNGA